GCRRIEQFSFRKPLCDWKAAPNAKGLRSDLEPGRGLLQLIFVAVDLVDNVADELNGSLALIGDLQRVLVLFDVALENAIEQVVLGKRVRVLLIGTQFGGWR